MNNEQTPGAATAPATQDAPLAARTVSISYAPRDASISDKIRAAYRRFLDAQDAAGDARFTERTPAQKSFITRRFNQFNAAIRAETRDDKRIFEQLVNEDPATVGKPLAELSDPDFDALHARAWATAELTPTPENQRSAARFWAEHLRRASEAQPTQTPTPDAPQAAQLVCPQCGAVEPQIGILRNQIFCHACRADITSYARPIHDAREAQAIQIANELRADLRFTEIEALSDEQAREMIATLYRAAAEEFDADTARRCLAHEKLIEQAREEARELERTGYQTEESEAFLLLEYPTDAQAQAILDYCAALWKGLSDLDNRAAKFAEDAAEAYFSGEEAPLTPTIFCTHTPTCTCFNCRARRSEFAAEIAQEEAEREQEESNEQDDDETTRGLEILTSENTPEQLEQIKSDMGSAFDDFCVSVARSADDENDCPALCEGIRLDNENRPPPTGENESEKL